MKSAAKTDVSIGYEVDGRRLDALVEDACAADETFREHSRNVAAISVRVGRELGLSARELRLLELAAEVHDLGKLVVPAEIITKPGALDEREWKAMRRHPAAGAELLAPCDAPAEVLAIVRSHHERWDGAGYPDGLRGPEIPLGARILAVADAYCAMIEARPYRTSRRPAAARAELLAQAGRQFDAACAHAACRVTAGAR
jgi:HD-GYP domain-containing protein (c-di-GMP phosphodiesterase class II)